MTAFQDFEIHVTVALTIKGTDYDPSDWDGDESAFRAEMVKNATEFMRNSELDIGDCWLDHVEPEL